MKSHKTLHLVSASALFFVASGPAIAKTITLSCPIGSAPPLIEIIDLDAGSVKATSGGDLVMLPSPATVTESSVTFFFDQNLGDNGVCRLRYTIDRQTAGLRYESTGDRSFCISRPASYGSVQCSVVPNPGF